LTASLTGFSLRSGGKPLAHAAYSQISLMLSRLIAENNAKLKII
jgi:hypothetical protein